MLTLWLTGYWRGYENSGSLWYRSLVFAGFRVLDSCCSRIKIRVFCSVLSIHNFGPLYFPSLTVLVLDFSFFFLFFFLTFHCFAELSHFFTGNDEHHSLVT